MFIGRTAAGPQVRGCHLGGAGKGAQGTAIPFREVAERIPCRRGKRGARCQARWRDSYCRYAHGMLHCWERSVPMGFGCSLF